MTDSNSIDEARPARSLQYGLRSLIAVIAACAVLFCVWPRHLSPRGDAVLAGWVALTIGYVGCFAWALAFFSSRAAIYSRNQIWVLIENAPDA